MYQSGYCHNQTQCKHTANIARNQRASRSAVEFPAMTSRVLPVLTIVIFVKEILLKSGCKALTAPGSEKINLIKMQPKAAF